MAGGEFSLAADPGGTDANGATGRGSDVDEAVSGGPHDLRCLLTAMQRSPLGVTGASCWCGGDLSGEGGCDGPFYGFFNFRNVNCRLGWLDLRSAAATERAVPYWERLPGQFSTKTGLHVDDEGGR